MQRSKQIATRVSIGLLATMSLVHPMPAQALAIVTVSQVNNDVLVSASGTLNITGLSYIGGTGYTYGIDPDTATFLVNPGPFSSLYQGNFSRPPSLGPGTLNVLPISGSGDSFGIALYYDTPTLFVPGGTQYSGGAISGTSVYSNTTIPGLGLTPGTYTWSWGDNSDQRITMQIGPAVAVPGPLPLLGAASALAWSRRLRRRRREASMPRS